MGLFSNLLGVLGNNLQIGGPTGPQLVNSSGVIQHRNAANSAYAIAQVANPVNDNDCVNLITLATYSAKPIPATLQISGSASIPTNSTTVQWYVVTTSGVNATIGQLYYDDGSNAGNCTLFSAQSYATIFTPNSLTGGTITFSAASTYYWNTTAWVLETVSVAGATYTTAVTIGTSASYSSTTTIAANAIIKEVYTKVTTAYTAGGTIAVGITGSTSLFAPTSGAVATTIGEYRTNERITIGASAATLLVTIGGTPSTGVGTVYVDWSVPLT